MMWSKKWAGLAAALCLSLAACGGGGGGSETGSATTLTLQGTVATGRAVAGAQVQASCQGGSGNAQAAADGRFQLQIAGGALPCVLRATDPRDQSRWHSVSSSASASSATVNITPLTEMLLARLTGQDPASYFDRFDPAQAASRLSEAALAAAQQELRQILSVSFDVGTLNDFVARPLTAATAANPNGGDAHDQWLDQFGAKLTRLQQARVVAALAGQASTASVQQVVTDGVAASAARLSSSIDLASHLVTLSWTDSYPLGTQYRVESRNADGSFSPLETIKGLGGTGSVVQWQRAVTGATVYRVLALLPDRTAVLSTAQGQESVSVEAPAAPPEILLDQEQPVSGQVQLSLSGGGSYASVSWYADLRLLGQGSGATQALNWNTSTLGNGQHLLLAKVQVSPDAYIELRRTVSVANSNLALSASASGTTGTILVDARASSEYGIAKVAAVFDGKDAGSLSEPNACSRWCSGSNDVYRFTVDAAAAGSGNHSMVLTATDKAGASKSVTVAVPVSNLPIVSLNTPVDGAFVSGSLQLAGSASSDKSGELRVTASLGDYSLLSTTGTSFGTNFSLAGVIPGSYTLTLRVTDSSNASTVVQRTVTVTAAALDYPELFTIGVGGQLLAAEGDRVLYRAVDGSVRLRHVIAKTEVELAQAASINYVNDWQLSEGLVYAYGKGSDCVLYCIYQWTGAGAISNLSNAKRAAATEPIDKVQSTDLHPVARKGYVVWIGESNWYTLHHVASGSFTKIPQPAGTSYLGNWNYDFFVGANGVEFYYWARTGGSDQAAFYDIYKWSAATGSSTRVSAGGARAIYPKTDGQSVVWLQSPASSAVGTAISLMSLPVGGGTASEITSSASESFWLRDGVLGWRETGSTGNSLKAHAFGQTSVVSALNSSLLYGAGAGQLVFGEQGKTYSWDAATRTRKLRIDASPNQVWITGNQMYFVMGAAQTVFRLTLD